MLLCAQFPTFFQFCFSPLPGIFVKVESCRACDCALRSLGGRFSLGAGRLTLAGRKLTRMCFQTGLKCRRVNLTLEALEKGLKSSLSLRGEVTVAEGGESYLLHRYHLRRCHQCLRGRQAITAGFGALQKMSGKLSAKTHYHLQWCRQCLRGRQATAAGFGTLRANIG